MVGTQYSARSSVDRLVARPSLLARLSATSPGAAALVCAPAGSGKTVLLRAWTAGLDDPVGWVSVERGEREAQRFWLNVIEALADAAGDDIIERVSPGPSFSGAAVLQRLRDQLPAVERPLTLVVDDLHELRSDDALSWLEVLLTHLPPTLRVVVATREDPALALHQLRLTGSLTELRGSDLRFSLEETRALLTSGGITLSDAAVISLHERTEGWPAGLRLAVISLANSADPERFVSEFSGSERTVAGYLLKEVLERQPPHVRELLLRTSILERVTGPLADELTGGDGAEAILQRLDDQNAFVSALDAARTWFRYHHLFADLLRLELRQLGPAAVRELRRTAAAWFERHGDAVEAVRHAQAAEDWGQAARLLLDNYFALTMAGRGETLQALLSKFPPGEQLHDGNLAAAMAMDNILHGLSDEAAAHSEAAHRLADAVPVERRRLFGAYLAVIDVELARRRNDLDGAQGAMDDLEHALEAPTEKPELPVGSEYRALALVNLGIAELWTGRPARAREQLEDALVLARRLPMPFLELGCLANLAIAAPLTGQPLSTALQLSMHALAIAEEHGWTSESMAVGAFAMAGLVLVRLARFGEAEQHLDRAQLGLDSSPDPGTEVMLHHARGMLRFGQGRLQDALSEFVVGQGLQRRLAGTHVFTVDVRWRAMQVRVRLGDTETVQRALENLEPQDGERAGMRIAQAALALELGEPERALQAVAAVIDGSASALYERWARAEALLLDALARDRLGDRRASEDSLEAALDLAEPEGLLLPFLLWPVRDLLERHPRHRTAHATLVSTILDVLAGRVVPSPGAHAPLSNDLSEAELRIVRYLPSNLTASEIAAELVVSANTVRTHMRHIYAKLDAHSRSEAVARARELRLVAPGAVRR